MTGSSRRTGNDATAQALKVQKRPVLKVNGGPGQLPHASHNGSLPGSAGTSEGQGAGTSSKSQEDLSHLDPKKLRRMQANRESAARSKERKHALTQSLEQQILAVKEELNALTQLHGVLCSDKQALHELGALLLTQVETLQAQLAKQSSQQAALIKEITHAQRVLKLNNSLPEAPPLQAVPPLPPPSLGVASDAPADVMTASVSTVLLAKTPNPPTPEEIQAIPRPWRTVLPAGARVTSDSPSALALPTLSLPSSGLSADMLTSVGSGPIAVSAPGTAPASRLPSLSTHVAAADPLGGGVDGARAAAAVHDAWVRGIDFDALQPDMPARPGLPGPSLLAPSGVFSPPSSYQHSMLDAPGQSPHALPGALADDYTGLGKDTRAALCGGMQDSPVGFTSVPLFPHGVEQGLLGASGTAAWPGWSTAPTQRGGPASV